MGYRCRVPSGASGQGTTQNPYLFKGSLQDRASGLVKFGLRWYNPTTGAWTQQDTLDAPLDPANANRYAFAGGDPINGNDPTGMAPTGCSVGMLTVSTIVGVTWPGSLGATSRKTRHPCWSDAAFRAVSSAAAY